MERWTIKNYNGKKTAELLLYGDVLKHEDYWSDEENITAQKVIEELKDIGDVDEIVVRLNTDGGDLFSGSAIRSMLKRNKAYVKIYVDGLAASAGSLIATAGDEVIMPINTMQFLHPALTIAQGNAKEFRRVADDLDKVSEVLVEAYMEKSGLSRERVLELMDNESFLSARECVELGLADTLEQQKIAASLGDKYFIMNDIKFDLDKFKDKLPENLFENKVNKNKEVNDMDFYKAFETEKEFKNALTDYKAELLKDEDFLAEIRNGYVKVEDVLAKFEDLEVDDLDKLASSVSDIKANYEKVQNEYNEYKSEVENDKKFADIKANLEEVGVDVKDEDKEEYLAMSEFAINQIIASAKANKVEEDEEEEFDFDPNIFTNLMNNSTTDEDSDANLFA